MSRPSSFTFLFWNLIFLVVLFYDCVSFPLTAFRIEPLGWSLKGRERRLRHLFLTPNLIAATFWSLDFILSFFVGYDAADGVVETRLVKAGLESR